jgi:hypothetical protein
MQFYEITCPTDEDLVAQIIYANNKYEAVGFYILSNYGKQFYLEDMDVISRDSNHKTEINFNGWLLDKTIREVVEEERLVAPALVSKLML